MSFWGARTGGVGYTEIYMQWLVLFAGVAVTPEARVGMGMDSGALALASQIESSYAWSIGVEEERSVNGGWRGQVRVEPQWPVGRHRRHLDHIAAAAQDYEELFDAIGNHAQSAVRFRWRNVDIKVFRSEERRHSAYASDWQVAYNVDGLLLGGARGVRETLFHELFHLNDEQDGWSEDALGAIYEAIVDRCGADTQCLRVYAPGTTMVNGGYYAFHSGEGAEEYAAELALRWYREHRQLTLEGRSVSTPFKCRAPENARAWRLLVDRFFGGIDLIPGC